MVGKIKFDFDAAARNIDKAFKVENESVVVESVNIKEVIDKLGNVEVLVGIPEETSQRKTNNELTNAELAFIHTHGARTPSMIKDMNKAIEQGGTYSQAYNMYIQSHGSPAYRIPPRPIIEPAIEANIEMISKFLKRSVKYFLEGNEEEGYMALEATGMLAQGYVRKWFTDERNEWPPNAPSTIKAKGSDRPLIDTGELRKSITYIVRENNVNHNKKLKSLKIKKKLK